jgi:hypothetical protein
MATMSYGSIAKTWRPACMKKVFYLHAGGDLRQSARKSGSQQGIGKSRCPPQEAGRHNLSSRGFSRELLNVHVDFPLFQRLALPVTSGQYKIPGIRIQDTRMIRLMEVLLHAGPQFNGWRTVQIAEAIRTTFALSPETYTPQSAPL